MTASDQSSGLGGDEVLRGVWRAYFGRTQRANLRIFAENKPLILRIPKYPLFDPRGDAIRPYPFRAIGLKYDFYLAHGLEPDFDPS